MAILEFSFTISSKGFEDIIDITDKVEFFISNQTSDSGIIYIYNDSNNMTIKNIEIKELKKKMTDINYKKVLQAGNCNNLSLPIINKKLYKEEMKRILLIDFEQSASIREIIVLIIV